MSPTVLRVRAFRLFFYSNEGSEPPHVHAEAGAGIAKLWLSPVAIAQSRGLSAKELGELIHIVVEHREMLLECWNEFFRGRAGK